MENRTVKKPLQVDEPKSDEIMIDTVVEDLGGNKRVAQFRPEEESQRCHELLGEWAKRGKRRKSRRKRCLREDS